MRFVICRLGISAIIFLSSCSKNKRPFIKIIKPTDHQIFNSPEVVEIKAEIKDSDAVTSEYLVVTKINRGNDTLVKFKDVKFSPSTYHLDTGFVSEPNTEYKIVISAYGHGNLSSDSVFIKSN